DHTQATAKMQQMVGSTAPTPTQLDAKHRQAMDMLSQMSGQQFDREYMRMMVDDHREAVSRFQAAASNGGSGGSLGSTGTNGTAGRTSGGTGISQFAQQTLPVLQDHLRMAQQIQSRLK